MGIISTGIFGGSFNPIHNGHIAIAGRLLESVGLDEIWFVVSPQNPFKRGMRLLDDPLRLDIARMAVAGELGMEVCDYEFRLPRPSYMWNTLSRMSADMPDRRFTLLIGADNWLRFGEWHEHERILDRYPVVIYPRRGCVVDLSSLPHGVTLADVPLLDVSSTDIRERIVRGEPIDGMVPDVVKDKIIECYEKYGEGMS